MRNPALADTDHPTGSPARPSSRVVPFRPPGTKAELDIGHLFDEHGPYLCRAIHRLTGSREGAEDIVQEVFLLAYHRRHELEDRAGIRTWLYRAAVNHVRHRRRSYGRYQAMKERFQQHPDVGRAQDGPDDAATRSEQGRRVSACVSALSDKLREVFVLYELEELEGAEIADILELPINTVWSRLRLARAAFRQEWTKRDSEAP